MTSSGCTVILPTYNEEENIGDMIGRLRRMYPNFKILVMDDNSKDGTKKTVMNLMGSDGSVSIVTRGINDKGLTASIIQGIMETRTGFFINMDSDFQHPPSALEEMYEKLMYGADLVIGVRKDRRALSFGRWASSWLAHVMANLTLMFRGKQMSTDVMSGLFGGRTVMFAEVVKKHEKEFERRGFKALFDLLKFAPNDIVIDDVYFEFGERHRGESKVSSKVIFSVMRQCGRLGRFVTDICVKIKN